jgi:hypothetical protein
MDIMLASPHLKQLLRQRSSLQEVGIFNHLTIADQLM